MCFGYSLNLCVFIIRKSCFLRRGEFVLARRNSNSICIENKIRV